LRAGPSAAMSFSISDRFSLLNDSILRGRC
jgi:hypothetical protein